MKKGNTHLVSGESAEGESGALSEAVFLVGASSEHVRVNDGVGSEGSVVLVLLSDLVWKRDRGGEEEKEGRGRRGEKVSTTRRDRREEEGRKAEDQPFLMVPSSHP